MRTIFISSFHPLISRNILATEFFGIISQKSRVVILAPDFKKEYFLKRFGGPNAIVEGIDTALSTRDLFFRRLALSLTNTSDLYIKRRVGFYRDGNFLSYAASACLAYIFSSSLTFLRPVRFLDDALPERNIFGDFLKKYQPSVVFSTDVQSELDVLLVKEAKKIGIKTIGMVRSWDNLTSKGAMRVLPDKLLVHNELVRDEAIKYNLVPEEHIEVVGIPHYDAYLLPVKMPKQKFFEKSGFDLSKKLILYSPIGNRYIRNNKTDKYILEILSSLDANILVRLPPTDSVNFDGFKNGRAKVVFEETGFGFDHGGKKMNEMSKEDDERLRESLAFCDVIVTGQSTIAIDAAVFDKPVVVAAFDHEPRAYWNSVKRYYDYEYYRKFRERSGIKLAQSPEELLKLVGDYLQNSALDNEVRQRIIQDQVYLLDNRASQRLANILLSSL